MLRECPIGQNSEELETGFMVQAHIVVVGSTMVDMITYATRVPEPGETIIGDSFALGFGGKGANQAVMAARLGVDVSMVNSVGDDVYGETTLENFHREGINADFVERIPGASGVAPIWVEANGTNRIIAVPGANNSMTEAQAIAAIETLPSATLVIGQLEIPQDVTAAAFELAQKLGAVTVLNPAPFSTLSPRLVQASNWIIPNETEFEGMHPDGQAPTNDEVILEVAALYGCRLVVTLGEAGAALAATDGTVIRVPAPQVDAIDTTGAGDAFVGAFAVGLTLGYSEEKATALGCACASDSTTRLGTQSSYLARDSAATFID
jgi:ribokinase